MSDSDSYRGCIGVGWIEPRRRLSGMQGCKQVPPCKDGISDTLSWHDRERREGIGIFGRVIGVGAERGNKRRASMGGRVIFVGGW